ncbi:MAG: hypothetical protein ACE5ES_04435 [Candidatus Nanoarchaeia archaeon]
MEVKIGNRYIEEFCSSCREETIHRVFKRYGKISERRKGAKRLRRKVAYCLICQKRVIENTKKRKK